MSEKEIILMQLFEIDIALLKAKEVIETQKRIGYMTPQLAMRFQQLFTNLYGLMENRTKLIEIVNSKYGLNIK